MSRDERRRLLGHLLGGTLSPRDAIRRVGKGRDAEPLVTMRLAHVRRMLERFLAGERTAAEVGAWADALEVRDDVLLAAGEEGLLASFLAACSPPEEEGPLTPATARSWLERLSRAERAEG